MGMSDRAKEIFLDAMTTSKGDLQSAANALCDGEYLTYQGYTDQDEEAVGDAYDHILACIRREGGVDSH